MEIPSAEQSVNGIISTIHGIAGAHAAPEISLGKVLTPLPDIKISYNGIILTKKDLYIDAFLLKKYRRAAKGELEQKDERGKVDIPSCKGNLRTTTQTKRGGFGKPSFVSHLHKVNNNYKANLKGDYEAESTSKYKDTVVYRDWGIVPGDLVVLLPINNAQKFVILNKVSYCAELRAEDFQDVEEW